MTTNQEEGVDFVENVDYNTIMPRPRKAGRLLMDTDLRIPMTSEQKQIIVDATANEPEGMAAWARSVLLETARRKLARIGKDKSE